MICGILLLSVSLSAFGNGNFSNVYAQAWTSTHTITYFLGNKLGAISFNFDDGYPSHLTAAVPQLNARGLKGTFFIITGRTDVSTLAPWSAWQSIAAQGHEVASHTVTHKDLTTLSISDIEWQLSTSQSAINQNIPGQSCNSLDYPFTSSNSTIQTIAAQYYDAARGGWISGNHPPFLNYYQSGSDQSDSWNALNFYNLAGKEGDALGVNDAYLTDPAFNESLDKAVLRHAWLNIFFHDITDATAFGKVLDYTQTKHDYWIDTFCNVSRYMKERLNSTIQIITDTPTEIRINILMDASLPTTTYNFPLTLRSTVPTSWAQVVLQQGSVIQTLTPVMEGSDKVVYYNAVPNGGDISLTATNTSTSTPTLTPTAISTATNVPTIITPTPTYTPTYTATNTPTNTPTSTLTFTETNTPNVIPTDTPTYTATNTPTDTSYESPH
jgi:peptidoglycan/xylan/chitin deacetylase (PgdA/CDA1 family)